MTRTIRAGIAVAAAVGAIAALSLFGESTRDAQWRLNPQLASVLTDDVGRNDCIIRAARGVTAAKAAQVCDVARQFNSGTR